MKAPSIKIYFLNNYLRVEFPANSRLLKGSHRIFFTNILGYDFSDNFSGYEIAREGEAISTLVETINYLKDNDLKYGIDFEVDDIIKKYENNADELYDARVLGNRVKKDAQESVVLPKFFKRELKKYQIGPVIHHSELKNSADFSVPGSGKTTISLAVYSILKHQKAIDKLIVVCPRAAFMPWEEEFFECFKRKPISIRINGTSSKAFRKRQYKSFDDAEILLLTYQMISVDSAEIARVLSKHKVFLILDESHNIKRIQGGKWATTLLNLAPLAARRMILSGTPMPNSIEDIWTQMTFLWPNPPVLGTVTEFKNEVEDIDDEIVKKIKSELHPFYWRIKKSDLKLKKPKFHSIIVKMRPYQQAIYDALAIKVLSELIKASEERIKLRIWRRARMIRLLQVASNPALLKQNSLEFQIPPIDATGLSVDRLIENYPQYEAPPKIEAVIKLTKELLSKNEKVLIWTSFIHNLKTLELALSSYRPCVIYGEVPKDFTENEEYNREKMIHQFKTTNSHNILIANPAACAESISLHKVCHHAIYLDRSFNGAQYMQSLDRIHRIGLEANEQVHYYFFKSKNSIDEVIDNRLNMKRERMLELLDDDFAILNLDSSSDEFSEETEEERDFNSLIAQLKKIYE